MYKTKRWLNFQQDKRKIPDRAQYERFVKAEEYTGSEVELGRCGDHMPFVIELELIHVDNTGIF